MKFAYQAQKLSEARRALMLPHPRGEAESIAGAFQACSAGFDNLDPDTLDYKARGWFSKITELMETSGIEDPAGRGTWAVKAEGFTNDQKLELSRAVDELAHWFDRRALDIP
jgi:hypothetical protein